MGANEELARKLQKRRESLSSSKDEVDSSRSQRRGSGRGGTGKVLVASPDYFSKPSQELARKLRKQQDRVEFSEKVRDIAKLKNFTGTSPSSSGYEMQCAVEEKLGKTPKRRESFSRPNQELAQKLQKRSQRLTASDQSCSVEKVLGSAAQRRDSFSKASPELAKKLEARALRLSAENATCQVERSLNRRRKAKPNHVSGELAQKLKHRRKSNGEIVVEDKNPAVKEELANDADSFKADGALRADSLSNSDNRTCCIYIAFSLLLVFIGIFALYFFVLQKP